MAGVFERLEQAADEIVSKLEEVTSALKELSEGGGAGGGAVAGKGKLLPGAQGKGGGAGGLLQGVLGKLGPSKLLKGGLVGVAAGATAIAGKAGLDGILGASRGGDFGSSAAASINRLAAKTGVFGELLGNAGLDRVTRGVAADLDRVTNLVARYGGNGAIRPEVRRQLAEIYARQNTNVELDRQTNAAVSEQTQVSVAPRLGRGAEYAARLGVQVNSFLQFLGVSQHQ